jgi:hypothetical protein
MARHSFVWLYFFNLLPSISRCVARPKQDMLELMDGSVRLTAWAGLFRFIYYILHPSRCSLTPDLIYVN